MKNKKKLKKAIFLDRDGVINKDKGYVYKIKDFKFEKNALASLKLINFEKFLVFIVCNQAGIGKGFYAKKDFYKLDRWLRLFLLKNKIKIKKTYFCPHHPEAPIPHYRKKCFCRKPNIGLLLKARQEFKIDLKQSYLIGDKTSDILAGKRAGCKTILLKTGYGGKDALYAIRPNFLVNDLREAIKIINLKTNT